MNEIRFPSLGRGEEFGYVFTNDSGTFWNEAWRSGPILGAAMGKFETYGDGMVQHAPLCACRPQDFTDYLISLASWLVAYPEVGFEQRSVGQGKVRDDTMDFLGSIVSKEKRQWFHLGDRKLSSSESREHDKRWQRVPDYANGTVESAVNLWFSLEHNAGLARSIFTLYSIHEQFSDRLGAALALGPGWDGMVGYRADLGVGHGLAFQAIRALMQSRRCLEEARETLERAKVKFAESSPQPGRFGE